MKFCVKGEPVEQESLVNFCFRGSGGPGPQGPLVSLDATQRLKREVRDIERCAKNKMLTIWVEIAQKSILKQ